MSHNPLPHVIHAASHSGKGGAIVLIIVGLFFTPWLIGIPILIWGIAKLCSKG